MRIGFGLFLFLIMLLSSAHVLAASRVANPLLNREVLIPTVQNKATTLLFSNDPENLRQPGVLYRDTISGAFRIFYYHVTNTARPMQVTVWAQNSTPWPAFLTIKHVGLAQPSKDWAYAGGTAVAAYLQSNTHKVILLKPGQVIRLQATKPVTTIGEALTGILSGEAQGPITFWITANAPFQPTPFGLPILPAQPGTLMRGTFLQASRSFHVTSSTQGALLLGANRSWDTFLTGTSALDPGRVAKDVGNYGVLYHLHWQITPQAGLFAACLSPRGGLWGGGMGFGQGMIAIPYIGAKQEAILTYVDARRGLDLNLSLMPAGGSYLPIVLYLKNMHSLGLF